jgi:LmbE family N-acetylglucosaminyl deacetylase
MVTAILGALAALAWCVWLLRRRRYRAVFRIPARRNDQCACREPHQTIVLSAGRHAIDLPAAAYGHHVTALLTLDVASTGASRLFDPYIEVASEGMNYRQYFERAVAGTRYLNLSPLLQRAGDKAAGTIALRGVHMHWQAPASLLLFEPPAIGDGDTLIVAPHPDDAEIAAFGWYAQRRSWIVTVTAGERSPTDLSPMAPTREQQMRWLALLRAHDSFTIPELGGVPRQRCLNLAFPDARLKQMHDNPSDIFAVGCQRSLARSTLRAENALPELRHGGANCTWRDLVEDLRWTLETVRPGTLLCPHPLVDPHHDHVYTAVALAAALRASAHRPKLLLLYVVHANEAPLYPFGAGDSAVSLPPWQHREWIADSIYSHPLSEASRLAKYFAVEAAHDLRAYPAENPRTLRELKALLWRELSGFVSGLGVHPTDYRRRAPRANEIYYVVSTEGFLQLAQRAAYPRADAAQGIQRPLA